MPEFLQQLKIHEVMTEDTWIKGDYTRLKNGKVCHCAVGWLLKVYSKYDNYTNLYNTFNDYLQANYVHTIGTISVSQWNDNPNRTYNEVYTAFKACDL